MDDLKQIIAKNLAALRKEMHLTQAELAEKINYTDKAVSKWERAESVPDIEILKKLADLYGVSLDYLVQAEHTKKEQSELVTIRKRHKRLAISYLAAAGVWLVAAIVFFFLKIKGLEETWKLFIGAIPASLTVLLIFNAIWGQKKYFFILLSGLLWTLLLFAFIMLFEYNAFFVFCIGIPSQVMIVIWSRMVLK